MTRQTDDPSKASIGEALGRIPSGLFVLTARHEDRRMGMLCSWVQQVCFEPAMVMVAIAKGRPIMPLISESHRFGLCQLAKSDKLLLRKFAGKLEPNEDPFLGLDLLDNGPQSPPLLANTMSYLDLEVACHMDVEGDHDLFVGRVHKAACKGGDPHVHIRDDGFHY